MSENSTTVPPLGGVPDRPTFSILREARATIRLAAPIAATMIGIMVVETTDVLMIGRLGEQPLAAGGLAVTIWISFLLFIMGVLNAVPTLVTQEAARDDSVAVRRTARQGLWAATAMSLPSALFLFLFGDVLLIQLGQEPALAALAQSYLNYLAWALVPIGWGISLRMTMAAYEVTMPALYIFLAAVPLNAILNWILMFGGLGGPEMGLPGAGLSTLFVDIFLVIAMITYMKRASPFKELELFVRIWRPDWQRFRRIFGIGLPAGGLAVIEHSLFSASTVMMGWVGITALAAHNVAFQVISLLFMIPQGLSQAANIRIAQSAGKGDLAQTKQRGWTIFGLTVCVMAFSAVVIFLIRDVAIGVFLDPADPARDEIVTLGALFLGIAVIFQLFDGLQIVGTASLRGLNDTRIPMLIGAFCFIALGMGPAYVLAFTMGLGGVGIWLGLLVGLVAAAILLLSRFHYMTATPTRAFRDV